ncbi:hypothetical protein Hanom_Chr15g01366921 [Helianthus anomalus]
MSMKQLLYHLDSNDPSCSRCTCDSILSPSRTTNQVNGIFRTTSGCGNYHIKQTVFLIFPIPRVTKKKEK